MSDLHLRLWPPDLISKTCLPWSQSTEETPFRCPVSIVSKRHIFDTCCTIDLYGIDGQLQPFPLVLPHSQTFPAELFVHCPEPEVEEKVRGRAVACGTNE